MNAELRETLEYYEHNAGRFVQDTGEARMEEVQRRFLSYIPAGGRIIDLGCGSGRDALAFSQAGYEVLCVDGSPAMCAAARARTGLPAERVICATFGNFVPREKVEGVFACASLLHLHREELVPVIRKYAGILVPGGCFYLSFKYGTFSGMRNGRYFTDLTEESLAEILSAVPGLRPAEVFVTADVRPGRGQERWLNALCVRSGGERSGK